jgi:anaerobic selenocysteine-containing dehydrogenase
MGVRHYDGNTTLCMASAVSGYKLGFGSDGPPGAYDDFAEVTILLVGPTSPTTTRCWHRGCSTTRRPGDRSTA